MGSCILIMSAAFPANAIRMVARGLLPSASIELRWLEIRGNASAWDLVWKHPVTLILTLAIRVFCSPVQFVQLTFGLRAGAANHCRRVLCSGTGSGPGAQGRGRGSVPPGSRTRTRQARAGHGAVNGFQKLTDSHPPRCKPISYHQGINPESRGEQLLRSSHGSLQHGTNTVPCPRPGGRRS